MDASYWSQRYQNQRTGWDLGEVSPPLVEIFKEIEKDSEILIPGCGNAYEAEYLFNSGYKNVYIIDVAKEPLEAFKKRNLSFPDHQIIQGDFFEHMGTYDFIVEQTFFCAIEPSLRTKYVKKMHQLLKQEGKLLGVLFNREFDGGPPYGGRKEDYKTLFSAVFRKVKIQDSLKSIQPRLGAEVIIRCFK